MPSRLLSPPPLARPKLAQAQGGWNCRGVGEVVIVRGMTLTKKAQPVDGVSMHTLGRADTHAPATTAYRLVPPGPRAVRPTK
jgi:hypothetical protein